MKTRQQAVDYGLTFKDTYMETPFRDTNWQLIRVKGSKKAFLRSDTSGSFPEILHAYIPALTMVL